MHSKFVVQSFLLGLLAAAPLAAGFTEVSTDVEKRYIGSPASFASKVVRDLSPELEARHHTEAQIEAKQAAAGDSTTCATQKERRDPHHTEAQIEAKEAAAGSTSSACTTSKERRDPHHTEAQIEAKEAAAGDSTSCATNKERRDPHHTEAQIEAKEAAAGTTSSACTTNKKARRQAPDEFGPWDSEVDEFGSWVDKREPHHTEAQIEAKEAAAGDSTTCPTQKVRRDPHHTEAQIEAKEAAADTTSSGCSTSTKAKKARRTPQEADEFGPWDSEVDEFGSWVDKRSPHHTEAQIEAKEAAAGTSTSATTCSNKLKARSAQEADEFGPWDSEVDEFGSWVDKRAPHHTEAQIEAKEAAAGTTCN